jgi:hypothetical protein
MEFSLVLWEAPRPYFAVQISHGDVKEFFFPKFIDHLGTRPQNGSPALF